MTDQFLANPDLVKEIASSTPDERLKKRDFWLAQRWFAGILIISLGALYLLAPYTYIFAGGWVFLTIFVQLLAVWGAAITVKALASLEVEMAIVTLVEARGDQYLREIKSQRRSMVNLDDLEREMLPHNPSSPPPAMIRLFQQICKEAKDRRFESSVQVIQPYQEEPLDDIFKLQNLQKIALWLGILGTFIGLLLAIQKVMDSAPKEGEDLPLQKILIGMFSDLYISFSASLAGLEVAVILGFFLFLLRKMQVIYFRNMESAAVTTLSLARHSINSDMLLSEFAQIGSSINTLTTQVYDQNQAMARKIAEIERQMRGQTDRIENGAASLAKAGSEFKDLLAKLSENQRGFLSDVKSVYDAVSLKNLSATMQDNLSKVSDNITRSLDPSVAKIAEQLLAFNQSIQTISQTVNAQTAAASANAQRIEQHLKNQATESVNVIREMHNQLRTNLALMGASSPQAFMNQISGLSQTLAELNKTILQTSRHSHPRRRTLQERLAMWDWRFWR